MAKTPRRAVPMQAVDQASSEVRQIIDGLETALRIDKNRLDDHLEEHPDLYYRAAGELALAKSRVDAAKMAYEEADARADIRIRNEYQDERITESKVASLKRLDTDVQDAHDAYLQTTHDHRLLDILVSAIGERGRAMSKLADLYVAGYFSGQVPARAQSSVRDVRTGEIMREVAARSTAAEAMDARVRRVADAGAQSRGRERQRGR